MSKYRFKTKEEFKRDGLWTKDHPDKWTTSGSMNKYLGQDIPDSYNITCDKQEKLYYETWTFRNCDYVLKEESFVLPSNWCVKVDRNCQPEEVYKWRQCSWIDAGYINNSTIWTDVVLDNYTEITLEQFKQHVLKESPIVESPKEENYVGRTIKALVNHPEGTDVKKGEIIKIKEITYNNQFYTLEKTKAGSEGMVITRPINLSNWELVSESPKAIDMKDIQEEAKKRFPIGCKFIPIDSTDTYTLIEDSSTYKIYSKNIWAQSMHGSLYSDGKWATLVSSPETTKEMFYEGDYIVTLDVENGWNCAKKNYCFKQRINFTGMAPEVDLNGSTSNSHSVMSFDKKQCLKDWRYATPEEVAEYERIGKPYDVTILQNKEESIPEYVECIKSSSGGFTVGKIYNWPYPINDQGDRRAIPIQGTLFSFKPSTKEAYEAQFVSKELTKEDLVEGEIYIYDGSQIAIYPEGPSFSIREKFYVSNPKWTWSFSITHATEEQKALLRSYMKKDEKQEWSEGTYAVGVKGNFGVYEGSTNPISVGRIFTVREDLGKDSISTKESSYWVYKENLRWFATYLEALDFSNQLIASPSPTWSDTSKLTPLEICKQKYRKGMKVMSADNSGMFSGEFTIEVDPDKFTITGAGVDYHYSRGWLYFEGKYAEILDETTYVGAYDPYQIEEVKKETFIENVQSVNVELISKKKIKIF